jgi:hypothetical protein
MKIRGWYINGPSQLVHLRDILNKIHLYPLQNIFSFNRILLTEMYITSNCFMTRVGYFVSVFIFCFHYASNSRGPQIINAVWQFGFKGEMQHDQWSSRSLIIQSNPAKRSGLELSACQRRKFKRFHSCNTTSNPPPPSQSAGSNIYTTMGLVLQKSLLVQEKDNRQRRNNRSAFHCVECFISGLPSPTEQLISSSQELIKIACLGDSINGPMIFSTNNLPAFRTTCSLHSHPTFVNAKLIKISKVR